MPAAPPPRAGAVRCDAHWAERSTRPARARMRVRPHTGCLTRDLRTRFDARRWPTPSRARVSSSSSTRCTGWIAPRRSRCVPRAAPPPRGIRIGFARVPSVPRHVRRTRALGTLERTRVPARYPARRRCGFRARRAARTMDLRPCAAPMPMRARLPNSSSPTRATSRCALASSAQADGSRSCGTASSCTRTPSSYTRTGCRCASAGVRVAALCGFVSPSAPRLCVRALLPRPTSCRA